VLAGGTKGEYHFDCLLDNFFPGFAEITGDDFKDFVATDATDSEMAEWITQKAVTRRRFLLSPLCAKVSNASKNQE